jgi:predicted amidohydrolase
VAAASLCAEGAACVYNSLAVFDSEGELAHRYRKTHLYRLRVMSTLASSLD